MYDALMNSMERDCKQKTISLHPGDDRKIYTKEELNALKGRDFTTRLYISSQSVLNNSVWIRTHHTDNAEHTSNLAYIRDYFKAAYITRNHTAAKATLTALLTTMFAMEESNYNSFATIVASGLSEKGTNTSFEVHNTMLGDETKISMLEDEEKIEIARRRLVLQALLNWGEELQYLQAGAL